MSQENTTLQIEQKTLQAQDAKSLHTIIASLGSYSTKEQRLHNLLTTLVQVTDAQLACVYEYQQARECLLLTTCSDQFLSIESEVAIGPGEGFVGWSALTRQRLVLSKDAQDDPRFLANPLVDISPLQAVIILPLETAEHQLRGVLCLQFNHPQLFTNQHDSLMETVTILVTMLIEQAQLQEKLQDQQTLQTALASLSQISSTGKSPTEVLRSLANQTLQIMHADLCTIVLQDADSEQPSIHAIAPQFNRFNITSAPFEGNGSDFMLNTLAIGGEEHGKSGRATLQALLSSPLVVGAEILGQVNCYSCDMDRYGIIEQHLLKIIANQVALILKNIRYQSLLRKRNLVSDFFQGLQTGSRDLEDELRQRAEYLGCDLDKPHTIAVIEIAHNPQSPRRQWKDQTEETPEQEFEHLGKLLQRRILSSFPGSLIHNKENMLTCLLHVSKDPAAIRLPAWLHELAGEFLSEHNAILSIGIGNVCQSLKDYQNGFAEASEALQMGSKLKSEDRVTHFNDLGVYRYLYKITRMDGLRDIYQDLVARIAVYDQRKNTDLLDTLEIYLEYAGNLTKTSNHLFVHRNTLIQRLERLQSLCDVNLQDRSNWLTLQVAIKVYRLRNTIHKG